MSYYLRIPNHEIKKLYQSIILSWFENSIQEYRYKLLLKSLTIGDIDTFSKIFQQFMISSVSVFDVPAGESEKVYHGFILGMLVGLRDRYEVKSNRESGLGRYDVMLIPKNPHELGIIMEFVRCRKEEDAKEKANDSIISFVEDVSRSYRVGFQEQALNHLKWVSIRLEFMSVEEKESKSPEVRIRETNRAELLLKHRNMIDDIKTKI